MLSASCILVHAKIFFFCLLELISGLPSCCSLSYGIKHLSMCSFVIASGFPTFVVRMWPLSLGLMCRENPRFAQSNFNCFFSIRRFLPHRFYYIHSLPGCLRRVVEIEMFFYSATALTSCLGYLLLQRMLRLNGSSPYTFFISFFVLRSPFVANT